MLSEPPRGCSAAEPRSAAPGASSCTPGPRLPAALLPQRMLLPPEFLHRPGGPKSPQTTGPGPWGQGGDEALVVT